MQGGGRVAPAPRGCKRGSARDGTQRSQWQGSAQAGYGGIVCPSGIQRGQPRPASPAAACGSSRGSRRVQAKDGDKRGARRLCVCVLLAFKTWGSAGWGGPRGALPGAAAGRPSQAGAGSFRRQRQQRRGPTSLLGALRGLHPAHAAAAGDQGRGGRGPVGGGVSNNRRGRSLHASHCCPPENRSHQALQRVLWPKGPARHTGVLSAEHCRAMG